MWKVSTPIGRKRRPQTNASYISRGVGQVTIDLFIEKETNFIVLHIQDLNVTEKVSAARSVGKQFRAIRLGSTWKLKHLGNSQKYI